MGIAALIEGGRQSWLQDPDVHLMLLVQGGDSDSFTELVRRYGRRVVGFVRFP